MNATVLRKTLVQLWSPYLISENQFHVDIGPMGWHDLDIHGICLSEGASDEIWKKFLKSRNVERVLPASVLVIDPQSNGELGGWRQTAVHEFAHLVRNSMEALYPITVRAQVDREKLIEAILTRFAFEKALDTQFQEDFTKALRIHYAAEAERQGLEMSDFENAVFPGDDIGVDPLLGNHALTWLQYDGAHDPLFYLIFYLLDRKAEDSGFYQIKGQPIVSRTF